MNDLVRLNTQDVSKAVPITDTFIISEKYQVAHLSVTKLIDKYKSDFEEFGKLVSFEMTLNKSQRTSKAYELNEGHFYLLVTYMKNTEIARFYKKEFIKAFLFQKKELQARTETRQLSKIVRVSMTDSINKQVKPGTFKNFAYGNYTKLVYKYLFGKTVKKLKEERNVPEKENLRNHLTIDELIKVQDLESQIATFIQFTDTLNKTDKEIYQLVVEHFKQPTLN